MADTFNLTTGTDVVTAPSGVGITVIAGPGTLNPSDRLTGGSGTDVLKLYNGSFDLSTVSVFTGFEQVVLTDANVQLGSQSLDVIDAGSESGTILLGSGAVHVTAGSGGDLIESATSKSWNVKNNISGNASTSGNITDVQLNTGFGTNVTYNLNGNSFSNIYEITAFGSNASLRVGGTTLRGVSHVDFYTSSGRILTAAGTLDLSKTQVTDGSISSTNSRGTDFIVGDATTGMEVIGGPGQDTVTGKGFAFTSDQRNSIFALGSVEKIVDSSGTYLAPQEASSSSEHAFVVHQDALASALVEAATDHPVAANFGCHPGKADAISANLFAHSSESTRPNH